MKKPLSLLLVLVMFAAALAAALPSSAAAFSDVEDGRWSASSIGYAVKEGYMNGIGGGLFDPEGSLTRAMVATVMWRREGSPAPAAPSGFTDVPAGEWYTDAVAWAKETGVVKGLTETTFGPDEYITREQLATMLFRFSSSAPVSVPERADLSPFADDEKVSDWADEPLEWAVEAGIINGTDGNRLAPDGFATREQFAAIIERYDNSFTLRYNAPVIRSHYTEKEYPLVTDADIYVSPDGDDLNPGTFEKPLATFAGAVAKVREIKAAKTEGDITVAFKAGNYGPVELELTAEDSGSSEQRIVYCKYGDGEVIFDNGVTVKESDFLPLGEDERGLFNSKFADRIKKADISFLDPIPGYDDFALFGEDGLLTVARYPDKYSDGTDQFLKAAETYDWYNLNVFSTVLQKRLAAYDDSVFPEMRIFGYILRGFRRDRYEIQSYDRETHLLKVGRTPATEFGGLLRLGWRDADGDGIRMILMNVPYELTVQGEYWVDRSTGTLYVLEPSGDYHISLPHGDKTLRGVENYETGNGYAAAPDYCAIYAEDTGYITFRGLRFTGNVGEFVLGYGTSEFEFDRCSFDHCTGRNALLFEFSLPDAPLGLRVTDCEFGPCVGRHVYVFDEADGPGRYTNRSDVFIDNCLFCGSNLGYDAEGAVNLHACSGGTVSHNRFEECSRCAIVFTGSCDVVIEYNDFDSVMLNSDDGGVTYAWGDVLGNNVIRYNCYGAVPDGSVGVFAHYCDDGDCGTLMYGNLLFDAGSVMYHGAGRDNELRENVLIGQIDVNCGSYTEEIIAAGDAALAENYSVGYLSDCWSTVRGYIETVPGYAEALESRRPGATGLIFDFSRAGEKGFFLAPTNYFTDNLFINQDGSVRIGLSGNAADYCTIEGNNACSFAENPVFVNPTLGDYRIRDGAEFPDIHFEEIGRY